MTPLRAEDITLYCEDREDGRSQRMIEAAIQALRRELPFALAVRPIGVTNKNDVAVRTKCARAQTAPSLRVFGVRDRDFLPRALVEEARARAFDRSPQGVKAWPLPRHCIESYLLDDDVLADAAPQITRTEIDAAADARAWLDIARGTLDDLAFRVRKVRQGKPEGRAGDRTAALRAVIDAAEKMQHELASTIAEDGLAHTLDALAADMAADGPRWCRVDGRELVYDIESALRLGKGELLDRLSLHAYRHPPAALVADLRAALEAMPDAWRADA